MSVGVSLSGSLSSMSMADLIQWARTARKTGVITARNSSENAERRIFLRDGHIVACASNDARDFYGNYLVRLGYCTEEDVNKALRIQRETGVMVGAILVMVEEISNDVAVATLTRKTADIICDIFLWPEGSFEYEPSPFNPSRSVPIRIDSISIAIEGMRRVDGWFELRTRIHPGSIFEPTGSAPSADADGREIARHVLALLDGRRDVEQVMELLPFSRYAILETIGELVAAGTARASGATDAIRLKSWELDFGEAQAAGRRGDWDKEVQIFEGLCAMKAELPGLAEEASRARERLRRKISETIPPDDVPVLAIGQEALQGLKLVPADLDVLSRIDGRRSVAEAARSSSLSELDALRSLRRLLAARVIDFPSRHLV